MTSGPYKILILGGTSEALALARRLAGMPELEVVTSLVGHTRAPTLPPGEVRTGGFGSAKELGAYLQQNGIAALVNATHPFSAVISANALEAHRQSGVPLLRLLRPAWVKQTQDTWILAPSTAGAAAICRWLGKRVLLTIGSKELAAFADLPRAHFFVRLAEPPQAPLPLISGETIVAKGPFDIAEERRLILENQIDLLIARNGGGAAGFAKIAAAREFSIPVVMIERPEIAVHPGSDTAESADAAFDWIYRQILRRVRTGESSATSGDSA